MTTAQIEERLNALKSEAENGNKMLANLGAQRADMQQTLLRISGAIQVLEELLATENNGSVPEAPLEANAK